MNYVSYETAVRLKEAGFPQPEPAVGQSWFDMYGKQFVLLRKDQTLTWRFDFAYFLSATKFSDVKLPRGIVFAPTAEDILRELKRLVGEHIEVQMETYENEFVVRLFEDLPFGNFDTILETNENPAEAAAQAFLNPLKK